MSVQSFSFNTIELIGKKQNKKEKKVCAKIARAFISSIEANHNFKAFQVKNIVFSLALAVSAVSESKICLKCIRRSLNGDKEASPEKLIVKKFVNNLSSRGNFSVEEVKNITAELYSSLNHDKVIHSFELIQCMRTFIKSRDKN